jgi:hypothetical protein
MNRKFRGIWIPAEIWLNENLSLQAKCLWAEIDSLCDPSKNEPCYASDEYLMDFSSLKLSRLHEVLKELKDAGLLKKVGYDGRNRSLMTCTPEVVNTAEVRVPENRKSHFRKTGNPPYIENKQETVCLEPSNGVPVGGNVHKLPAATPYTIEKRHPSGKPIICSHEEFLRLCVMRKKDFTLEEIDEAWLVLLEYSQPIGDWIRFLEGIIEKNRSKKCHKTSKNTLPLQQKRLMKNEEKISFGQTSENATSTLPSPEQRRAYRDLQEKLRVRKQSNGSKEEGAT